MTEYKEPFVQDRRFRVGLAIVFAICAVWLFAYSGQMLNFNRGDIPWYSAWAWFEPVRLSFSMFTPVVYVGYVEATKSGTLGMVLCLWSGATFYLMASIALVFLEERIGVKLSMVICFGNTMALSLQTVRVWHSAFRQGGPGVLAFVLMIVALIAYLVLGTLLFRSGRSIAHDQPKKVGNE